MGVVNNYNCCHQLCRLVPVVFTPVQQFCTFIPVQLCTFLNVFLLQYSMLFDVQRTHGVIWFFCETVTHIVYYTAACQLE